MSDWDKAKKKLRYYGIDRNAVQREIVSCLRSPAMTNQEKLLICARAVGYETDVVKISDERTRIDYFNPIGPINLQRDKELGEWLGEWNPRTNDAQAMELLRHYIRQSLYKLMRNGRDNPLTQSEILDNVLDADYNLDNEAIINAVVAMEDK